MTEISPEVIKAYALENAIKHEGKPNQNAILAGLFAEGLDKSKIKEIIPRIQKVIKEINALTLEEQKKELESLETKTSKRKIREGLPPLPNAQKGKVVMRFAPFPSGPLHIGNARTLILNDEYTKMYDGKLILVIDDTIGSVEKPIEPQAYKLIEEGMEWLGVDYDKKVIYKSNRIEKYYEYANELIKKGYMYVCSCTKEKMHELKVKGTECSCRDFPPTVQMSRWKKMFTAKEGSMIVRLKTSMSDPDPAFRDRVMFRISDRPHAKLGKKYRVYPLLDFSWAIDDHYLGITHILRGMELTMETRVEKFIWDIFGWPHPEIIYNGHFEIQGLKISKSKGAKEVKSGKFTGWNDPRTWSLQSLRDRGFSPKALRQFILNMGLKKTNITVPIDVLYALNKKEIGELPRHFFLENPGVIKIKGAPPINIQIPFHPNGKLGSREFKTVQEFLISKTDANLMKDANYRLIHLLNFKSDQLNKLRPRDFSYLSKDSKQLKEQPVKFIQWLPTDANNIKTKIMMPDGSIIKGLGEESLSKLKIGDVVSLEMFGIARLHKKDKEGLEFWFTQP